MIRLLLLLTLHVVIATALGQNPVFIELSGNYILPGVPTQYSNRFIRKEIDRNSGFDFALGQQFYLNKIIIEPAIGIFFLQFRSTSQLPLAAQGDLNYIGSRIDKYIEGRFAHIDSIHNIYHDNDLIYYGTSHFTQGYSSIIYLSLPLKIKYPLWRERIYAGLGFTPSFLMGSKHFLGYSKPNYSKQVYDKSSDMMNTIIMSGDISIAYNISQDLFFNLTYHQGFSNVFLLDHFSYRPNRISVGIIYYIHQNPFRNNSILQKT
jgi:hypothetical protein